MEKVMCFPWAGSKREKRALFRRVVGGALKIPLPGTCTLGSLSARPRQEPYILMGGTVNDWLHGLQRCSLIGQGCIIPELPCAKPPAIASGPIFLSSTAH